MSAFVGSARRLANGHTLVAFGMSAVDGSTGPIEVFEVNRRGESIWHLELGDTRQIFRAEPWSSIGSEYATGTASDRQESLRVNIRPADATGF
jgi:hypothetical protein